MARMIFFVEVWSGLVASTKVVSCLGWEWKLWLCVFQPRGQVHHWFGVLSQLVFPLFTSNHPALITASLRMKLIWLFVCLMFHVACDEMEGSERFFCCLDPFSYAVVISVRSFVSVARWTHGPFDVKDSSQNLFEYVCSFFLHWSSGMKSDILCCKKSRNWQVLRLVD